ncbi:tRNA uridine-5-carboxymethylaminomethyl(34) synthesis GTPase MnmE [Candidatus Dependentiae bacterium]|nr:tRNA uridine-5-carboxymethylaminomethyl(34) synthesis GTPase MnmE [Candidatus Dependentiae bacterium]
MTYKKKEFLNIDNQTIIALCTPSGNGAIAMLRLCGDDAVEIVDKISLLYSKKKLSVFPTHTIHYGRIVSIQSKKEIIDEVLFFLMKAPKTFTGQHTVEISCHNNQYIIEQIIKQAIVAGARIAHPGEFTKRAFLNNKIDLIQAESINDLINAQTELALRKSMSQLQGSLSRHIEQIQQDLFGLLSIIEGGLEFFEEEQQDFEIDKIIRKKLNLIIQKLKNIKSNFSQQQQIKEGIKIAVIGWVNAGKSTLFNSILKKNRAIVTDIEGTTRDSIECSLYKNGNFWLLTDTAGLRQTKDLVEQEGIDRSFEQAEVSDIILLTFDLSKKLNCKQIEIYRNLINKYKNKIIFVGNKLDVENDQFLLLDFINKDQFLKISALHKKGIELLENEIENKIQNIFSKHQSSYLLNKRQYNLILQVENQMKFIEKLIKNKIEYELMAYYLREIIERFSELTGRNINEKMLDRIFNDFCIGK